MKPLQARVGGSVLLAYEYAEDGVGSQCAPSHAITGSTANSVSQEEGAEPLTLLSSGWTLVYPDHEGPNSAYAAGRPAGQITLDSIRAALRFSELGLDAPVTPIALWGYSGGAVAVAWAAALQKSYAPELNIKAVATGGTPADGLAILRNADTNPVTNITTFALLLSAIEGVNRDYPLLVTPILNDKGRAAFEALKDGCGGATSNGSSAPSGTFADFTTTDPYTAPGTLAVAPLITLPLAGYSPIADTFVYHSMADQLIPIATIDKMVNGWCGEGSPVHYYRGATGEHVSFGVSMVGAAQAYLEARVASTPSTVTPAGTTSCN